MKIEINNIENIESATINIKDFTKLPTEYNGFYSMNPIAKTIYYSLLALNNFKTDFAYFQEEILEYQAKLILERLENNNIDEVEVWAALSPLDHSYYNIGSLFLDNLMSFEAFLKRQSDRITTGDLEAIKKSLNKIKNRDKNLASPVVKRYFKSFKNIEGSIKIIENGNIIFDFEQGKLATLKNGLSKNVIYLSNLLYHLEKMNKLPRNLEIQAENLFAKLLPKRPSANNLLSKEKTKDLRNELIKVMGCELTYEDHIFTFREHNTKYRPLEVSDEIRVLGVLQLLLENNVFEKDDILILSDIVNILSNDNRHLLIYVAKELVRLYEIKVII